MFSRLVDVWDFLHKLDPSSNGEECRQQLLDQQEAKCTGRQQRSDTAATAVQRGSNGDRTAAIGWGD